MKLFALKETDPRETRASLDPAAVKKLTDLGVEIEVESGIGERCSHRDGDYETAGAKVVPGSGSEAAQSAADCVLRVRKPSDADISRLKKGAIHIIADALHQKVSCYFNRQ